MSRDDDVQDVWRIPDERLMAGEAVPEEPGLTSFVATLRATAQDEPPAPSAELAALLRDGLPQGVRAGRTGTARVRHLRRVGAAAGLVVAAKVALAGAAAAAAVVGVAHLDGAPEVLREPARAVVDAVVGAWHGVTGSPAVPSTTESPEPAPARDGVAPVLPSPACAADCPDVGSGAAGAPATPAPSAGAPGAQHGRSAEVVPPAATPAVPAAPPADPGRSGDAKGQEQRATPAPSAPADRPTPAPPGRG